MICGPVGAGVASPLYGDWSRDGWAQHHRRGAQRELGRQCGADPRHQVDEVDVLRHQGRRLGLGLVDDALHGREHGVLLGLGGELGGPQLGVVVGALGRGPRVLDDEDDADAQRHQHDESEADQPLVHLDVTSLDDLARGEVDCDPPAGPGLPRAGRALQRDAHAAAPIASPTDWAVAQRWSKPFFLPFVGGSSSRAGSATTVVAPTWAPMAFGEARQQRGAPGERDLLDPGLGVAGPEVVEGRPDVGDQGGDQLGEDRGHLTRVGEPVAALGVLRVLQAHRRAVRPADG